MDIAAKLAAVGAPHGTVVETDFQHAGRGRQGRPWVAPPGSALLTSWILRAGDDPSSAGVLSPLAALAVLRAIRALVPGAPVGYKWPNDVLVEERKVAGILLSSRPIEGELVVIAGIGVNLDPPVGEGRAGRAGLRTWRAELSIGELRDRLAAGLESIWQHYIARRSLEPGLRRELEELLVWHGERVEIELPSGTATGRIVGLDAIGALRFAREASGTVETLHMGEIVRGPRRSPAEHSGPYRILSDAGRAADEAQ